ncbi:MAG: hypothetical protein V4570_05400 [Pseudomonadota bacterium]
MSTTHGTASHTSGSMQEKENKDTKKSKSSPKSEKDQKKENVSENAKKMSDSKKS